ncbi:MAG: ABC transporter substrate-binding protein, partial [Candidatus Krumholzibacteriota bacterium]|nr:ABC transporter substrate-binding protein [Candidatus Krumholzibacteriota bacterium]
MDEGGKSDSLYPILIGCWLMILTVLPPSGEVGAQSESWLNVALSGSPVTCDPAKINDALSTSILQNNVFEPLVRYDGDKFATIEPNLAVSWETREAGKIWIFHLRPGVRFHDGTLLTAADVVNSIKRNRQFTELVEEIGGLTIRILCQTKRVDFLKTVSKAEYGIAKVLPQGGLAGTGPFYIERWEPSSRIILRTFDLCWRERPNFTGVRFHCGLSGEEAVARMKAGEIDLIDILSPSLADRIKADEDLVLSILKGTNICYVQINTQHP